jgi:ATPase subunit of ABC transporter with duplicated ATPase domains
MGRGKAIFSLLIKGELKPKSGNVNITDGATIGAADQVMSRKYFDLTVEDYFKEAFEIPPANIKSQIAKVLEAVNFDVPTDRRIKDLSGGQQARLLLAFALIQNPDILLLDEPTNNLDSAGIDHLISFLLSYDKTVIVISHDADFLNILPKALII